MSNQLDSIFEILNILFIICIIIVLIACFWKFYEDSKSPISETSKLDPLSKYETHEITNIKGKIFGFKSKDNTTSKKIFKSDTKCVNCKFYNPKDNFNFLNRISL